jgi:hypothetical protein
VSHEDQVKLYRFCVKHIAAILLVAGVGLYIVAVLHVG